MIVCMVRKASWTSWAPYAVVVGAHTTLGLLLGSRAPVDEANQIWTFETMGM